MGLVEEIGRIVREKGSPVSSRNATAPAISSPFPSTSRCGNSCASGFTRDLLERIEHYGLVQDHVTLELTESQALLGIHSESARLEELSAAGFHLSVDDFGQGHSSLASLHEMPVEELKIDMKFVHNLHTEKGRRIVQAIEELSRILKLETVAEGVETEEQERVLQKLGITRLQGFRYSKPLPEQQFLAFLRENGGTEMVTVRRTQDSKSLALPN